MEIPLVRTDLAQVGTTKRNCLKVVPVERVDGIPKTTERIVVGSSNGSVVCLFRRNGDTQVAFKTMPGKPVEALVLGGAIGSLHDKVFIASDNTVKGISKKGKNFFVFETNMTEPIRRLFIYGVEMVCCGTRSYYHFHDCTEADHVMFKEDILDVVALPSDGGWVGRAFTVVIACNDSTVKVIECSRLDYQIELSDIPITLQLFMGDGGHNKMHVVYGTKTGRVGLLNLPVEGGSVQWEISTTSPSAITCMTFYPFCGPSKDMILGKEDGTIEIYNVDVDDNCTFRQKVESVTAIACGRITKEDQDELVACTYTGWVFTCSKGSEATATNSSSEAPQVHAINAKMMQLKNEVTELEAKVMEERAKLAEHTKKDGTNSYTFVPFFQIHDSFELNKAEGLFILSVQLVIPINMLIVLSDIPLKLVDVDRESAIVSYSNSINEDYATMLTYRCQASQTRVEMRVGLTEGKGGRIILQVCPHIHPPVAQLRRYEVKPLCMHVRAHNFDSSTPFNSLTCNGTFSLAEMHCWLFNCFDGIPNKTPPIETVTYSFTNIVDGGSQLQVTCSRGKLNFRGDSVATIAILRDFLSRETIKRNIRVDISCDINEESVPHSLRLLHPKISRLHQTQTKAVLSQALRQLQENTADLSFLSADYLQILKEHDELLEEAEKFPIGDSPLIAVYENLLINRWKLAGKNASSRLPALRELLLKEYSLESAIAFYQQDW